MQDLRYAGRYASMEVIPGVEAWRQGGMEVWYGMDGGMEVWR